MSEFVKMDIHQIVKDCLHIPCKLSQIMGVLPFSFDNVNRIQFSFRNLPSLFFFLFMSITIPWSIFYSSIFDEIVKIMAKSLPEKARSTTETVSMGLILNVLNFSGIIIRLVTIQQRYKIINFYEEFNSVLPEIFNPSCSLGHPHKETILGWFRDAKQSLKWAWYCMAAIQVLILPFPVAIAQADLNETFSKFRVAMVAGLVLNGVYDSLYHIIIFWLVSIINCITIAYKTLNLELTEAIYCTSRPSPYQKNGSAVPSTHLRLQENAVLRFLVNQRRLEQLVHKFNHTFMYQISIILGIHFVGLTLHSFSIIAAVVEGFGLQTLGLVAMMLPLGFSEWKSICTIFNSASLLADEVKCSVRVMCDLNLNQLHADIKHKVKMTIHTATTYPVAISPGNIFVLDWSSLRSTLALMVTYIFVLLQFKTSERPI